MTSDPFSFAKSYVPAILPRLANWVRLNGLPHWSEYRDVTFQGAFLAVGMITLVASSGFVAASEPDFSRDVLPILSKHCFSCHGPDESHREANLRLDVEADVVGASTESPVVAGNPQESLVWQRMQTDDRDLQMPPLQTADGTPIDSRPSAAEVELVYQWIKGGAKWGKHWSLEPIANPQLTLPEPESSSVNTNPIDTFVALRRQELGLPKTPRAEPHLLVRRLYQDLVGIQPSPEVADAFAEDLSPYAYQRLVDELLARPEFGEHWGRIWLDLARYADTKGYEKDLGRTMWPYRDWVIQAFNEDMPLTEFTEKQLAGDLLPDASAADKLATAFHRNTMSNDEGGTDDEEFRVAAVKDRVDLTMQVWMGMTMGCAKCHTHKYDPISMTEYYQFYSIFNQTEDADRYDDSPKMTVILPEQAQRQRVLEGLLETAQQNLQQTEAAYFQLPADQQTLWRFPTLIAATSDSGANLHQRADGTLVVSGPNSKRDSYQLKLQVPAGVYQAIRVEAIPVERSDGSIGLGRSLDDPNFVLSELQLNIHDPIVNETNEVSFVKTISDFSQQGWPSDHAIDGKLDTGWAVSPQVKSRHAAIFVFAEPLQVDVPQEVQLSLLQNYGGELVLAGLRVTCVPVDVSLDMPLADPPTIAAARQQVEAAQGALREFIENLPQVPVMRELDAAQQRVNKLHVRGNFLELGEPVTAQLPAGIFIASTPITADRLGVARWLMHDDNPLTARVWANRVWARLFGMGIVETEEDFGMLGSYPSHPALLDWLAVELRRDGWSIKSFVRKIVLSETYQQSSQLTAQYREVDPRNQYLTRGARFRLPGEVIRDSALSAAGMLSTRQGGPPVMPPQPDGLWRSTYNGQQWINAVDEDRWRRGVYTFWKRTTPYPSLTTFDAGSREVCQIRRIATNTPLQALVTLNDPVFLEAAGALAIQMMATGNDPDERLMHGFRRVLIRPVSVEELTPLRTLLHDMIREFEKNPQDAQSLIDAAVPSIMKSQCELFASHELAAWITIANILLNHDEFLNRN